MRITRISLPRFKNLIDFSIGFSGASATTVIVGRNASGKSNLLAAIATIFRDLDAGPGKYRSTEFEYEIDYQIFDRAVSISHHLLEERWKTEVLVDGEVIQNSAQTPEFWDSVLPQTVFAYYSGPSDRLSNLFDPPLVAFRDAMIKGNRAATQRLIYGRPIHGQFVLMSFLADGRLQDFPFLARELGIESIDSVLFVMSRPYWSNKKQLPARKKDFWGAKGVVREFLNKLYDASLAPLQVDRRVPMRMRQHRTVEQLHLFLPSYESLAGFVEAVTEAGSLYRARDLFTILESAYVSDLVQDIQIALRKKNCSEPVGFHELSEGEQQLLMVLGLLRFTKAEESLFLLDEPDTHLNPAWSRNFLGLIDEAVGDREKCQLLVASHDPVAISLLRKDQVRQLTVDAETGHIDAQTPEEDPINLGVDGVLLSELFGLPSVMAPELMKLIAERDDLRLRSEPLTVSESRRLGWLEEELGHLDLSGAGGDPLYSRFVAEMARTEQEVLDHAAPLSPDEIQEQRDTVAAVIQRLRRGVQGS